MNIIIICSQYIEKLGYNELQLFRTSKYIFTLKIMNEETNVKLGLFGIITFFIVYSFDLVKA